MSSCTDGGTFEAIVVGTGFGGAVTACRLAEAGFRICVLERGRRYGPADFPTYPTDELFASDDGRTQTFAPEPDFSRWLWSADHGIYDIRDLDDTMSVQAAGYGGGSLIYANVHLRPPRAVFEQGWPDEYKGAALDPYFDLAAWMLGVSPIPKRLAKTVQLQRAAEATGGNAWFRAPLAINFDLDGANRFRREQHPCDMRGRCWRGCDRQAKNTLDMNYLARAEDGPTKPDIRTLAEVTCIERTPAGGFKVTYDDLLVRGRDDTNEAACHPVCVYASYVFLCAGSVNTTELLFRSSTLWGETADAPRPAPLGSHYFPNADSVAVVFDCNQPHEADYGPTITSAVRVQKPVEGDFGCSLDFANGGGSEPAPGTTIKGLKSDACAELSHTPILDWGCWAEGTAVGALPIANPVGEFTAGEPLQIGDATAVARSRVVHHEHWFLVEDGGYPPDLEPLVGVFRSPMWLRRNRYLEDPTTLPRPTHATEGVRPMEREVGRVWAQPLRVAPRRVPTTRIRVGAFVDAIGATSRRAASSQGVAARTFDPGRPPARDAAELLRDGRQRELLLPRLLNDQFDKIFPEWFVRALRDDRAQLLEHGASFALHLLTRLLDELSKSAANEIDPMTRASLGIDNIDGDQLNVLIRGMLRQALQILAGSEVAVATKAAQLLFNPVPDTPGQVLDTLGDLLLWVLDYDVPAGHTGVLLTLGRDRYRGKLLWSPGAECSRPGKLTARLPSRLLDSSSVMHERVLRDIARNAWTGELRTNPGWTTLGKRVTVHSQGGCPMGKEGESVTSPAGEVYGCAGLYVMDAAAFPTSVGVNPSATIAAVAELKIERFIRKTRPGWSAEEKAVATRWVDGEGRETIDPLNHVAPQISPEPESEVIGLRFPEKMQGFLADVQDQRTQWEELDEFPEPKNLRKFIDGEATGTSSNPTIKAALDVTVSDLARLVSPERTVQPMRLGVTGQVTMSGCEYDVIERGSFLQLFVRPSKDTDPPTRFFRYHLRCSDHGQDEFTIDGLKVLRDAPGLDFWHDTSVLYVELAGKNVLKRGVLRLSVESFISAQMQTMEIFGTLDLARKSWALAAFYRYFAGELREVYARQADALIGMLKKLVTTIHV